VRVLIAAHVLALAALLVSFTNGRPRFPAYRVDLDVYRLGSAVLLHGGALYGTLPSTQDGQHLPFTYPPFAAILLSPLTLMPYWTAGVVMTLLTLGLAAVVLVVVLRSLDALPTGSRRWVVLGALLLLAEVVEPLRTAVYAGQVDVLLMALVALDVLVDTPRWPRGLLVGLAAALKLTPAVFVLYFLLRRDRRAAAVAGLSFLVATRIGFLCAGSDSVRYWTGLVFDDTRIGDPAYASNQSWLGMLTRTGLPATQRTELWLALAAVTVALTVVGMRRALAARQHTVALGLNAVCGLLISPISWSHHWVWVVVVLPGWIVLGRRTGRRLPLVLGYGGLALFLAAPQWWWPYGGGVEHGWNVVQQLTGASYVYYGAALLAAFAIRSGPVPTRTDAQRVKMVSSVL
jgi:alpha-1,2-mannosyltransferase